MNNHPAIARYYAEHHAELTGYALSRLGNPCDAEDVVHDAFLRIITNRQLITELTLPSLVYTVMRRLITDRFRHTFVEHQFERRLCTASDCADDVESVYSAVELNERLERCIARLPENCRHVYRLHIYDGMKTAQISEFTGEAYRSVEHRLSVARKQVRERLKSYIATAV